MHKQSSSIPNTINTEDDAKSAVVENTIPNSTHNQNGIMRKATIQSDTTTTDSIVGKSIYQSTLSPKSHTKTPSQQMNNCHVPRETYERRDIHDSQIPYPTLMYHSPHMSSLPYAPRVSPNNNGMYEISESKTGFHPHKPRPNMNLYPPQQSGKQQMPQNANNVGIRQNGVNRQTSQSNLNKKSWNSNSFNKRAVSNPGLSDKKLNGNNNNCDKNNNVEPRVTHNMACQQHPHQSPGIYKLNNGDKTKSISPPLVDAYSSSSSNSSTSSTSSVQISSKKRDTRRTPIGYDRNNDAGFFPLATYNYQAPIFYTDPDYGYTYARHQHSRKGRYQRKYPEYSLQARFQNRPPYFEVENAPVDFTKGGRHDHVSRQIWMKFVSFRQTDAIYLSKMASWKNLETLVNGKFSNLTLHVVGSTLSGFGSHQSDVDICIVREGINSPFNHDMRTTSLTQLKQIEELLKTQVIYSDAVMIPAKVPILRFKDTFHQIEVDMNFNNAVGLQNTHLLLCYSQMDWRLRPLGLVIKLWAKFHNINSAQHMTISSYSLILMVINYLQCVKPPVLPCLHKQYQQKFAPKMDISSINMNEEMHPIYSQNVQTLSDLLFGFFKYYSSFNFSSDAISVRNGCTIPIEECRQYPGIKNDPNQWKELCIEEPFDRTNTAHSCYDAQRFECIKLVFKRSYEALCSSLDLDSIFFEPFLLSPPEQFGN